MKPQKTTDCEDETIIDSVAQKQMALAPSPIDGAIIDRPVAHIDWQLVQSLRQATIRTTELPNYLLLPEATKIIDSAKDIVSRMFYILLWMTGGRLAEIIFLMKENFHLDNALLPHILLPTFKRRGKSVNAMWRKERKRSALRAYVRRYPHRMLGYVREGYILEV